MAKTKEVTTDNIYEGLTEEEIKLLLQMSGQANNASYERAPNIKINFSTKKDKNGNKVDVGNFVLGQVIKQVDGAKVVEEIGKDLGQFPEITVLKVAQQYSYYNPDKAQRCSSQLLTEMKEVAVGSTLKHECASGTCPRRAKDIAKDQKCTCQYVVYVETADKERALMYCKGASFMPFKAYLDEVGSDPIFFYPTTLNTKEKSQGSVDYYEIHPQIDKSRPYPLEQRKENMQKLAAVSKDITSFKSSQVVANKQLKYVDAEVVNGAEEGFDDISF